MIGDIRQSTGCGIRQICASLEVPRSSFYHAAEPTLTQSEDRRIGDLIEAIFKRHRRRYGYRRIGEELSDAGEVCAPDRIRRIMRQRGLRAIQPKTYVPKTSDGSMVIVRPRRVFVTSGGSLISRSFMWMCSQVIRLSSLGRMPAKRPRA